VEPRMAYYCRLYAIKRVSSSKQQAACTLHLHAPFLEFSLGAVICSNHTSAVIPLLTWLRKSLRNLTPPCDYTLVLRTIPYMPGLSVQSACFLAVLLHCARP
jgi:hypothetical protein